MKRQKLPSVEKHTKKEKNGQNDIMTEGRTRYMIVRVERGHESYTYSFHLWGRAFKSM